MTKTSGGKIALILIVVLMGAVAAFGYFKQSNSLEDAQAQTAADKPAVAATADVSVLLAAKPSDIILGDHNALITIVEYNSLSCTHCAHFHETVLPTLDKEYLTTGKVKLVLRHFPLNAPALKASQLIECAGTKGLERANFMKVLFNMQEKWAFDEGYLKSLKQIASVGGIDSATFDSCMADKSLEDQIVATRQEAQDKLGVDATPFFFINGKKYEGDRTIEGFRKALSNVTSGSDTTTKE